MTQAKVTWEERHSTEKISPHNWPVVHFPKLVNDVGSPIPQGLREGQVVLSCISNQTEQTMRSKPVSIVLPRSLLQLLPPGPVMTSVLTSPSDPRAVRRNSPFFPKVALGRGVYHSRKVTRTPFREMVDCPYTGGGEEPFNIAMKGCHWGQGDGLARKGACCQIP